MKETKVILHGHIDQPSGWSILFHQIFAACLHAGIEVLVKPLSAPLPTRLLANSPHRFSPIFQDRLCQGDAPREFHQIIIAPPTHVGTRPHTYVTCLAGEDAGKAKSILAKATRVLCPHNRIVPVPSEPFRISLDGLLDETASHTTSAVSTLFGCGHSERLLGFLNRLDEILKGEPFGVQIRPTCGTSNPSWPIDKRCHMPPPRVLDWPEKADYYASIACYLTDRKGLGFSALEAASCGAAPVLLEGEWDDVVPRLRAVYLQPDCLAAIRARYLASMVGPTIQEVLFR